ncbi:MAG: hypothetical protein C4586_08540 [Anaerolineaceae bacterium]|nr:MAG: hypothetical protein C4586_08540 [Anaerolineaceae bacterium]
MSKVNLVSNKYYRLASMMAVAVAVAKRAFAFAGSPSRPKPKAVVLRVLRVTPGKQHAWCLADCGGVEREIKKQIINIPKSLMNEYRNAAVTA